MASTIAREGEFGEEWNRSRRTFAARGGWHIKTREGHPLGPYPTEFDAEVVAALLIAQLSQASNAQACRRIIYNFRHDDRFRTVTAEEVARLPTFKPAEMQSHGNAGPGGEQFGFA